MNSLLSATRDAPNVKLITFGAENPAPSAEHDSVQMDNDLIFDDVSAIVRDHLMVKGPFSSLNEMEQETIVTRLVDAANGSFVWSKLVAKTIREESKPDGLRNAVEAYTSSKPSITDLVSQVVSSSGVTLEAKHMLLWLATAERPLHVKELATLLSIQVDKISVSEDEIDPLHVLKPIKALVFLEDELVYIRHAVIRQATHDLFYKGSLIPNLKDRHADFLTRLLVYTKTLPLQQRDVSLNAIDTSDVHTLVHKHTLLDFALRYWPSHLRNTTAFLKDGSRGISKDVSKFLPTSVAVVQVQHSLWQNSLPTPLLYTYSCIDSDVLRETLTPKHGASLQSIILVAQLLRQLGRPGEATPLIYQAALTSHTLLTTKSVITMQLLRVFLELTSDQVAPSRTDIMTKREETLLILMECYKIQYGSSSESVITIWRQIAEHYHFIKEVQKAHEFENMIQSVTQVDAEQHEANGTTGNLAVKLRARKDQGQESRQTLVLDKEYDDKVDSSAGFDFTRSMETVRKYISQESYEAAECLYVQLWQQAVAQSYSSASAHAQEQSMKATLEYSKFLQSRGRPDDAASILSSFWQDFHKATLHSETSLLYLRDVANLLKTVKLPLQALAVFKRCAGYFESTNNTQSPVYKELRLSIEQTIKEVLESSSSSIPASSESTLERIIIETAQYGHSVDQVVFTATENLIKRYEQQHRWRDATRLLKGVLQGVWPSLFSTSKEDVTLPAKHVDLCVKLAQRLGQCYRFRRRSSKEKDIHFRIYRALRSERKVEDQLRKEVTSNLLRCYEANSDTDLVISTHEELLADYTEFYGPEHNTVVKQLWTLANLTRPQPVSIEYYQQIIRILNKGNGSKPCHPDAFEPLVIVATDMWGQSRYTDAVSLYKILFTTFLEQEKLSSKLQDASFVREVFDRYTHCLRVLRTDFTTLHGIMTSYRTKCKTVFGPSATITVLATLSLARLCQESKRYESEAIVLYEELLRIETNAINHQEITAILETLYEERASVVANSKGEDLSSDQAQKAKQRIRERITSVRKSYGWAHEESLTQLTEIVNLYVSQNDTSSAVSELNQATSNILSSTTSSTSLANAASSIASGYLAVGQRHKALDLTDEIYRQVILRDTSNSKDYNFELSGKAHASLIFLAQMRHSLTHQTSSVTEILSTLTTEMTYFEDFERLVKSKNSTLQAVFVSASRLYHFLLSHNKDAAQRVLTELKNYFVRTEGKRIQCTDTKQVHEFIVTMLDYTKTYQVRDMTRSVGIASNERVVRLLKDHQFDAAVNLATVAFKYISSQSNYRTPEVVKFVFLLGMNISGRGHVTRPKQAAHEKLLSTSATLLQEALQVTSELKLNLALMDSDSLNNLVGVLGEQGSHKTLSWILGMLWNSRDVQQTWQPGATLALGRRYVMARYLVGDTSGAVRLAEDIVYNVRRVHGPRHHTTLDMSVLLSQIYTGIGQKYQAHKGGVELAKRYYKKSAATHENILRAFTDVDIDTALDGSMSMDGHSLDLDLVDDGVESVSPEEHVRKHFKLLKLAVQRLGEWPKDYSEYERLNADLYREFPTGLKGIEGVEKWDLKKMGGGKAESDEDLLNGQVNDWALFESDQWFEAAVDGVDGVNGVNGEEEL